MTMTTFMNPSGQLYSGSVLAGKQVNRQTVKKTNYRQTDRQTSKETETGQASRQANILKISESCDMNRKC